ncbi:hypothetical protein C9374_008930 [Naegleria lovaniensis]|uniref:RGS domain-containing protein n=1 Tax=Naegleria lovaniensis TaxID=51637 RepID=A0AA88KFJ1_NAELO|nr:uncharacterized protein C9374_008930 [Naegleria lovaniensis]KAG2377845.1 hypothetical protein C9374_008930 [Naegleria lovaniensis]
MTNSNELQEKRCIEIMHHSELPTTNTHSLPIQLSNESNHVQQEQMEQHESSPTPMMNSSQVIQNPSILAQPPNSETMVSFVSSQEQNTIMISQHHQQHPQQQHFQHVVPHSPTSPVVHHTTKRASKKLSSVVMTTSQAAELKSSLSISILAILIIAIMTIYSFIITSFPVVFTLKLYGNSVKQYNEMVMSEYLMVFARDRSMIQVFNESRQDLQHSLNQLFQLMPQSAMEAFGNESIDQMKLWPLQNVVLDQVMAGNATNAVRSFLNVTHYGTLLDFLANFNVFIRDVKNISYAQEQVIISNSTSYLIVIVVCLAITLPIVIVIFTTISQGGSASGYKGNVHTNGHTGNEVIGWKQQIMMNYKSSTVEQELLNRVDLLEDIQLFKQPAKQELNMMRSLLEELREYSDDSTSSSTMIEQDALSSTLSYRSSGDTFSVAGSVASSVVVNSRKNTISQLISIYEKYLNPSSATHPVKCKGHQKIANYLRECHDKSLNHPKDATTTQMELNLLDEIQVEVARQLIPIFEHFQKTIPEGKDVEESSDTLFKHSVLTHSELISKCI